MRTRYKTVCAPNPMYLSRITLRYRGSTTPTNYCLSALSVLSYFAKNLVAFVWSRRRISTCAAVCLGGMTSVVPGLTGIGNGVAVRVASTMGRNVREKKSVFTSS